MGYEVTFEHIKGKNNVLADILSRKFTGKMQKESRALLLYEYENSKIHGYDSLKIKGYDSLNIKGYVL